MTNVLAFDFGASSGRAIIGRFDGKRIALEEVHRFSNDPVAANGCLYWDFLRLFFEIKAGILKAGASGQELSSLGIDTWGVDFGLLDENGDLLGNPVHYRDSRTEGMLQKANELVGADFLYAQTGIQQIWFNTLYQLLAMKQAASPSLQIAKTLLFMPDLFNYMLTGEKATEYTIASTSQLLNPRTGTWAKELFEKIGFSRELSLLPALIPAGTVMGSLKEDISEELGVARIPVVAVASHDTASAVASVPFAGRENSAYISCGTWSLMGMELASPATCAKAAEYNFTNEGGVEGTTRFLKNIMGLWIIQECRRQWQREGEDVSFAELEAMAWEARGLQSFIDPDHESFAPPGNMPRRIRAFCEGTGQPVPQTMGEVIRCVAQSLAMKYRYTLESMEDILGVKIETIHMVGGGIKDTMVCRFTANATGRAVQAGPTEATAAGNVMVQLMALGKISSLREGREIIKNSFGLKEYRPEDAPLWEESYQSFKNIIG